MKNAGQEACPAPELQDYFGNVTPVTVTLTLETRRPLVFSTAPITASCTARATSGTAEP